MTTDKCSCRLSVCAFVSLARATRQFPVLVVCRRHVVGRYRRGIRAAGGNVDNLSFTHPQEVTRGRP